MRDNVLVLSNSQAFASISTGEVSTNVLNMETDSAANALLTDDQIGCFMNITVISAPAQATIVATEGICFQLRTAAAAALTSVYEICGSISVIPSLLVAGKKFSIPIKKDILQTFVGAWVMAISTALVGTLTLDIELSDQPISENESLQKVVS
jgi:hypothetical protein